MAKTNRHLNTLQVMIIRGVWAGATYEDIAQQSRWSEAHVKSVGAQLWDLLSEILLEPVNKKNFRAIFERHFRDLLVSGDPSALVNAPPASLEFPDGPVNLTSDFYCDRPPIETRCYAMITQPGVLIRIRAPRQMGKTSLLNRIVKQAEDLGYHSVSLNLRLVDSDILQALDRFLLWFCGRVTQQLNLPLQMADYWDDVFGSKTSCKDYFENYLLPTCQQPLVLALDEVDTLFNYPATADAFFALLRACYEEARNDPRWQLLRLILVHSTDAYIPLNIHQSPFNVGMPVELPEFNPQQVATLAERHSLHWTMDQVQLLMDLLGGHPYLIRLALYHMVQTPTSLEDLLATALSTHSPFFPHLQNLTLLLQDHGDWLEVLRQSLTQSQPIHLPAVDQFQLTRLGILTLQNGNLRVRCELYRQWLQAYL
jgi:hypothetical protein